MDAGPGFGRSEPTRHTGTAPKASMHGMSDTPVSSMTPIGHLWTPPIEVSTGPRTLRAACAFRCDDEMATSARSAARTAPARRTCFFAEAERPRSDRAVESVNAVLLRTFRALLSTIPQLRRHTSPVLTAVRISRDHFGACGLLCGGVSIRLHTACFLSTFATFKTKFLFGKQTLVVQMTKVSHQSLSPGGSLNCRKREELNPRSG